MTELLTTQNFTADPANKALWDKVMAGFKLISGQGWEQRANYEHFWPLCDQLYKLAYGSDAEMSERMKASLLFMLGGHAGRKRKGLRQRPYFHHILMVWYLAMLLRLPYEHQTAAIHHDDGEDIPKNLKVTHLWVMEEIERIAGVHVESIVFNLSNDSEAEDKHAAQVAKMAKIPYWDAVLKLLDRVANLYDMRQDAPKGFTPDRVAEEVQKAKELVTAIPQQVGTPILAMVAFAIEMLEEKYSLA